MRKVEDRPWEGLDLTTDDEDGQGEKGASKDAPENGKVKAEFRCDTGHRKH